MMVEHKDTKEACMLGLGKMNRFKVVSGSLLINRFKGVSRIHSFKV